MKIKRILQVCGVVFLATSAVALTNTDKKVLEKNADKIAQLRTLKNIWNAM